MIILITIALLIQRVPYINMLVYGGLLYHSFKGVSNSIKALLLSFLFAFTNNNFSQYTDIITNVLRWCIFISAFYNVVKTQLKYGVKGIKKSWIFFSVYIFVNFISSWIYSVNVYISFFKLSSFIIGIYISMVGIQFCEQNEIEEWIYYFVSSISILNLAMIFIGREGYYKTIYSSTNLFCGILNHPNLLGAFNILSMALYIFFLNTYKEKEKYTVICSLSIFITTFLSKARTAILGVSILFLIFMLKYFKVSLKRLTIGIFSLTIVIFISYLSIDKLNNNLKEIVFKYDNQSILYSRESQFSKVYNQYKDSPLIGLGFGIDRDTYDITNQTTATEKGNIVLGILSESGILGMIFFILWISCFIVENFRYDKKELIFLIGAIFFSNMGELTFFSMNSLGIVMSIMLGIYSKRRLYEF